MKMQARHQILFAHASALIALLWIFAGAPAHAADKLLDRPGALAAGGRPDVFEAHASDPYVYLLKERSLDLSVGKTVEHTHEVIAVTAASGRDVASRKIILHESAKLHADQCATIAPNGVRIPLGKDGLRKKSVGRFVEYDFQLPSVAAGSILDFCYDITSNWSVYPYDEFLVADQVPVLHARYVVHTDETVDPIVIPRNCDSNLRVLKRVDGKPGEDKATIQYDFYDVGAIATDPLAAPAYFYEPNVVMYWNGRRNWNYMVLSEGVDILAACDLSDDGTAKKLVKSLTESCSGDAAKCEAIFGFVRREIQIQEGASGWYVQRASETLESRMGTDRDAGALAVGMLRLAEIPVVLGLVRPAEFGDWNGQIYMAWQFHRFLPLIKIGTKWHWLDPGCQTCGYDDLEWNIRGTQGLVFTTAIEEYMDDLVEYANHARSFEEAWNRFRGGIHNAHFTDIIKMGSSSEWAQPSQISLVRAGVDASGTLHGEGDWIFSDDFKLDARAELRDRTDEGRQEWCLRRLQACVPRANLTATRFRGLEPDLGERSSPDTLLVHLQFEVPGFVPSAGPVSLKGTSLAPPIRDPLGPNPLHAPLWNPQSAGRLCDVTLALPANVTIESVPHPAMLDGETLRYQATFDVTANTVHFTRIFVTHRGLFTPDTAETMHKEYAAIHAIESNAVILGRRGAEPVH